MKSRTLPFVAALGVFTVFYGVPTALEHLVSGPLLLVLFGDIVGCLALSRISWKIGATLYAGLTGVEAGLVHFQLISPSALLWCTDLVPALVLAAFAAALVSVSDMN